MKTFAINTLGCKVNQYESQQIRQMLENLGLTQVYPDNADFANKTEPDIIIVNSCCVTKSASSKTRQLVNKSHSKFPGAVIVISGCLATVQLAEANFSFDGCHLVKNRQKLTETLTQLVSDHKNSENTNLQKSIKPDICPQIKAKNQTEMPKVNILKAFSGQTRAFLKVQDGCDGYCSYCIIPKTRPIVQSRAIEDSIAEAENFVKAGHKEIVITGIFLGAYGLNTVRRRKWPQKFNDNLPKLLANLAKIPNLPRIRLSSLEPGDLTEQLLDIFCQFPNIMPHLHLSLQSGSNSILKKMGRQYSAEDFLTTVKMVKSRLDSPAITTDIIVGFPGETDTDFQDTISLARQAGFSKIHVFPFSPRTGTSAASMKDTVKKEVIKDRAKQLRRLDSQLGRQFRDQFIGQNVQVLIEQIDEKISGKSERYFTVELTETPSNLQKNTIVNVTLTKNSLSAACGKIVPAKF